MTQAPKTPIETPEDWRAAGSLLHVAGHDIFVLDTGGDAPEGTVFVLHGFPTAGWDFHRILPALAARYRVVIPDMLGFGLSAKPRPHSYSIPEQADLMEGVMVALGVGPAHVLAHDYGDTVAQEMLARDNARAAEDKRFRSLCLLNGGLFPETHRARLIQKLLAGPFGGLVNRLTTQGRFDKSFSAVFGAATQPARMDLDAFWRLICANDGRHVFTSLIGYMAERRANRQRWLDALVEAQCPLQLINGSDDPVSGAHMVARYRELVRADDDIVELPDIGHYPQVEAPAAVAGAYLAFLERLGASDGREAS